MSESSSVESDVPDVERIFLTALMRRPMQRKAASMIQKIESVIGDLLAIRKEMPDQHWLKQRMLVNEIMLRMSLVDAEKMGLKDAEK